MENSPYVVPREVIKLSYGRILARLRKESGLTQGEVAEYVSRFSEKPYSAAMVSHWERDVTSPFAEQFLLLCELYAVVDIQGTFQGFDAKYRNMSKLNSLGKSRVEEYISMLSANSLFREAEESHDLSVRKIIKLYDTPVTTDFGLILDSDDYSDFEADETVPTITDFAVKVSGDSMEPRFIDGQIIFIKEQQTLEIGEIGILELNGDTYVRKLGHGALIPLNPKYDPIKIREFDSIHIFGKVLC